MKRLLVFIILSIFISCSFAVAGDYTRHNALEVKRTVGDDYEGRDSLRVTDRSGNLLFVIDSNGNVSYVSSDASRENLVENAKLSIWSGGTCQVTNLAAAAPDNWKVYDTTNSGATRYDFSDSQLIATGATAYGYLGHAMYIQGIDSLHGMADEIAYNAGVSNQAWYYQKFRGQAVQWGAMVYTDTGTTGATDFIRPYIITSTNTRTTAGVSTFATYSTDYANGGWEFISATTTVPNAATAFEVGFEIKNSSELSGESAFILGPTLFIGGNTVYSPIQKGPETILFAKQLDPFGSGGSTFGASTTVTSMDLSSDIGWNGIVPDDVSAIYVTSIVSTEYPNGVHYYGDNSLGGVTAFGVSSGTSPQAITTWIPVGASGAINVLSTSEASGTSLFIHGAKVR